MIVILLIFLLLVVTGGIHLSGILTLGAFAVSIPIIMALLVVGLVCAVIRHLAKGPSDPMDTPY